MDTLEARPQPGQRDAAILAALEALLDEARRELERERSLTLREVRKAIRRYRFTAAELWLEAGGGGKDAG